MVRLHALRPLIVLWLALLAGALAGACDSGSGAGDRDEPTYSIASVSARGAYGVGVTTVELVDRSRPTEPNRDYAGAPERTMKVEIWYPATPSGEPEQADAPLDRDGGPYPLIVFAHGLSGVRRQSASYTQHLASHGYVVASPDFPLSNLGSPGGPRLGAVTEQPGDVSFVIDSVIDLSHRQGHLLEGSVDADAIGMTGHSLGGLTTLITVYGPFRDPRIDAALPISPPGCFVTPEVAGDTSVPILVMAGSRDLIVNTRSQRDAYDAANAPRYWTLLLGANHTRFADIDLEDADLARLPVGSRTPDIVGDAIAVAERIGGSAASCVQRDPLGEEPLLAPERQRELLRAFAVPFFDAYLRHSDAALRFFREELPSLVPEVTFEADGD